MKLNWAKCQCGHKSCKLEYPTNLGQFYQGTGFRPDDKLLMDLAFATLDDYVKNIEAAMEEVEPDEKFVGVTVEDGKPVTVVLTNVIDEETLVKK